MTRRRATWTKNIFVLRGTKRIFVLPILTVSSLAAGCLQPSIKPGDELKRFGDEIVVCGRLFHTGTRVVLWTDPGGFDGYRVYRRFSKTDQIAPSSPTAGTETPNRYSPVRGNLPTDIATRVAERGWSLEDLQQVVDLFVMHYDVCGTSRRCFEVLHDVRGLSVHFMLDVDGTIYQTLDLKERARHAGSANDRSIGIEIANMGAYEKPETLAQWYRRDADGHVRLILPEDWRPVAKLGGTTNCLDALVPSHDCIFAGDINGKRLYQFDLTQAQYESLIRLAATISYVLPNVRLQEPVIADAPNDERFNPGPTESVATGPLAGTPINRRMLIVQQCNSSHTQTNTLQPTALAEHQGLIGHYHLTKDKADPGPAFDWERVIWGAAGLIPTQRAVPIKK